jgi:hypothetical protein
MGDVRTDSCRIKSDLPAGNSSLKVNDWRLGDNVVSEPMLLDSVNGVESRDRLLKVCTFLSHSGG